ncbi:MAG: DNA recombination protein RmuC [Bacteroidetes bacterium]|nr:DNA recombination protein RmuC [Bacteroidota bacterium]
METIIFLVVGLILGLIIGYLIASAKKSGVQSEMAVLAEKSSRSENEAATLKTQLDKERGIYNDQLRRLESEKGRYEESARRVPMLEEEVKSLQETYKNLKAQNAALNERYISEKESFELRLVELKEAKEALTKEFENIANRIFESKNQSFTELSRQNLESLLKPFKENITEFKTRVENIYTEETRERSSLRTELRALQELNRQLSEGAQNLTDALKGDNKTLGDWGEVVLERIFETSGLEKGREYDVQFSTKNSEGSGFRPDAIIYLPGGKQIVVDVKTSLKAYEKYHATDNEEERELFLKDHIRSVRQHIKMLSDKSYFNLEGINSLDYVLMFIPIEPAFNILMKEAKEIYTEAFDKGIIIVTQTTLFVTLKTIQNIWKTEKRNQNAVLIANKAQSFVNKLEGFIGKFEEVGRSIDKAQRLFGEADGQLKNGRGNLVSRGSEIARLGGLDTKKLKGSDEDIPEEEEN